MVKNKFWGTCFCGRRVAPGEGVVIASRIVCADVCSGHAAEAYGAAEQERRERLDELDHGPIHGFDDAY